MTPSHCRATHQTCSVHKTCHDSITLQSYTPNMFSPQDLLWLHHTAELHTKHIQSTRLVMTTSHCRATHQTCSVHKTCYDYITLQSYTPNMFSPQDLLWFHHTAELHTKHVQSTRLVMTPSHCRATHQTCSVHKTCHDSITLQSYTPNMFSPFYKLYVDGQ